MGSRCRLAWRTSRASRCAATLATGAARASTATAAATPPCRSSTSTGLACCCRSAWPASSSSGAPSETRAPLSEPPPPPPSTPPPPPRLTKARPASLPRRAQLLAIYDEPRQHATLVRYYRRLGFAALREVGDGAGSFGDQLAWGGVGTLMETDVSAFRRRWGASVRRLGRAADGGEEQLGDAGGGEEETRAARV
mmetsp:Transcript_18404/g.54510  ORF Transcript_18404/g.54510 Transcript_18404/m.54510 type:complete len:195 (+) Transcript_18404:208-792(+)